MRRCGPNFRSQWSERGEFTGIEFKKFFAAKPFVRFLSFSFFAISAGCMLLLIVSDGVEVPLQPLNQLIPTFPIVLWVALAFFTLGLFLHFGIDDEGGEKSNLAIGILALFLFYGVLPLAEDSLRWQDSWLHSSFAMSIAEKGHLTPQVFGYHSWPGFYFWFAQLQMVTGIDVVTLAKAAHLVPNIIVFVFLFLLYKRLGLGSNKAALLGLLTFLIADDRMYYHISPQNFGFPLLIVFFYLIFMGYKKRSFWLISLVLLFANIISHPFTPVFIFSALLFLGILTRFFSLPGQSTSKYLTTIVVGVSLFIGWALFAVDKMWWEYGTTSVIGVEKRLTGTEPLLSYAPTYFRWASPPFGIGLLRLVILGVGLSLSLFGIMTSLRTLKVLYAKEVVQIRRAFDEKAWPFFAYSSLLLGTVFAGVAPFVFYRQIMGFADRFLLFLWIPLAFFSTIIIWKQKRKRLKIALTFLILLLIVPAFINTHWHEFWLSTHKWEENGLTFTINNCDFSKTFLTDGGTTMTLWGMTGAQAIHVLYEGNKEKQRSALPVFTGEMQPQELNWTYLIHNLKGDIRLELLFDVSPDSIAKMNNTLTNSTLINRVYDDAYFQLYYRINSPDG